MIKIKSNPTNDFKIILNLNLKGKKIGIEHEAHGLTGRNALRLNIVIEKFCSIEDKSDLVVATKER